MTIRTFHSVSGLVALLTLLVRPQPPLLAQTSATVYNDGRVFLRRTIPVSVPSGLSAHRLGLGSLLPSTVFPLDTGVTLTGATYDAAVDEQNTMRRALGRQLSFWTGGTHNGIRDTIIAEVVGVDPERFRLEDGTIIFGRPGTPRYTADLIQLEPTLSVSVRSTTPRSALRVGYFTDGASWEASYQVILGRSSARVTGMAVIPSQHLRLDSAEVQLLAGSVGRQGQGYRLEEMVVADRAQKSYAAAPEGPAGEQQIGESHLYTLPGRISLRPGLTTTAALFDPLASAYERVFDVRGQIPYYGGLQQYGDEITVPVQVTYVLKRSLKSDFGDRPVPGGVARIYQPDDQGRLQLIGESSFRHSAPGQDLRLNAGQAFDVTAKRLQTNYTTRRDSTRTTATAAYTVTLSNAKDTVVTVNVIEERGGEWSVLSSSVPAERISSTQTRFRVRVPVRGEVVLTYRVRVTW